MASVRLEKVVKRFLNGVVAVNEVDLEVADGEFLVLIGPSGCGKTTLLRLIAGLEECSSGSVVMGDQVVNQLPPKQRNLAMVFQNDALYPNMSVYGNLTFGFGPSFDGGWSVLGLRRLFQPGRDVASADKRQGLEKAVRQTASRLGIDHLLERKPHQLSGGERQRVALGRAIVRNPAAFLFDEPLSSLDAGLRQQMRLQLKELHADLKTTMIYVTHDQVEAMTLGDRVAVMNEGQILQIGRPIDLYQRPANLFVARLMGAVPINLWQGNVKRQGNNIVFSGAGFRLNAAFSDKQKLDRIVTQGETREVCLGIRSEDLRIAENGQAMTQQVVTAITRLGDSTLVHFKDAAKKEGRSQSFTARLAATAQIALGQTLELDADPDSLMWFDSQDGNNLLEE